MPVSDALQFDIAAHYDVMAELDRDVHDDEDLARTEVGLALRLLGTVPESVFLPCCGTGRHIAWLLRAGVQKVFGVDLSQQCLDRADGLTGDDRVELIRADLLKWHPQDRFDAALLLGNSFGDPIKPIELSEFTGKILGALNVGGRFVMDYIGEGYLERDGRTKEWRAMIGDTIVRDRRTMQFDPDAGVMTIEVDASIPDSDQTVWSGAYQKRVLTEDEVMELFAHHGMRIEAKGVATDLNPSYYGSHDGETGMIARATWWLGTKVG